MRKDIDREEVVRLYVEEEKSSKEIAKIVGLSGGAIFSILRVRGIKTRSLKDSLKAKYPNGRFGEAASHWKGGRRRVGSQGCYIGVYLPTHPYATKDGYVMEHRLVMENKLGRILDPKEVIHHINGNKKDNRIDNLELHESRGTHTRHHFNESFEADGLRKEIIRLKKLLSKNGIAC